MNKCILILLFVLALSGTTMSQNIRKSDRFENKKVYAGLKLGANLPRMYYSNRNLSDLPHDLMVGPSFGLFVEFPLHRMFSLAAEFNWQKRGGATSYTYEKEYHVSYKLESYYTSLRIPLYCYFPISQSSAPYLCLGLDAGYSIGGSVSLSQPGLDISDVNMNLNDKNYNPLYIGALIGVGMRHNLKTDNFIWILKWDVALNWDFLDTFSDSEHNETAVPANVNAYNHQGTQMSRGLEAHISIGFIHQEDMSACRTFE